MATKRVHELAPVSDFVFGQAYELEVPDVDIAKAIQVRVRLHNQPTLATGGESFDEVFPVGLRSNGERVLGLADVELFLAPPNNHFLFEDGAAICDFVLNPVYVTALTLQYRNLNFDISQDQQISVTSYLLI
jgi:hypothetical protein